MRFPTRGGTSAPDAGRSAEQVSECVSNACREKINGSVLSSDSNTHLVMLIKRDKMAHISIHLTRRWSVEWVPGMGGSCRFQLQDRCNFIIVTMTEFGAGNENPTLMEILPLACSYTSVWPWVKFTTPVTVQGSSVAKRLLRQNPGIRVIRQSRRPKAQPAFAALQISRSSIFQTSKPAKGPSQSITVDWTAFPS